MAMTTIRKRGLCNKHFDDKDFTNADKKRLNWNAIPKPCQKITSNYTLESTTTKSVKTTNATIDANVASTSQSGHVFSDFFPPNEFSKEDDGLNIEIALSKAIDGTVVEQSEVDGVEPLNMKQNKLITNPSKVNKTYAFANDDEEMLHVEIAKLKKKYMELIKKNDELQTKNELLTNDIRNLNYTVSQIPHKIEKAKNEITLEEFLQNRTPPVTPAAKALIKVQLHKPGAPYDNEERDISKQLFYHSHAAYTRLREAGCNFPAESTVRSWIAKYDVQPGFSDVIFNTLKEKMSALPPNQRLCSLAWDEMSIKEYQEYSEKYDIVEGLQDLGPLGRFNKNAKYVFFFNLTSLNAENPYHQPVAYFFTEKGGMTAEEIGHLTKECLRRCRDAGVDVRLLVCDQGPNNQRAFNDIFKVKISNPTWTFEGKTYYLSYDFPHLIKRLVTALRTHGEIWDEDKVIVSWKDFVFAKEYDSMLHTSRLLDHITPIHLQPNSFQSMNVKRAFQIFGRRYAKAIKLAGVSVEAERQNQENDFTSTSNMSNTWERSAGFAEKINDIIDACNSYGLHSSNPNNLPLSPKNPQIAEQIKDLVEYAKKWRIRTEGRGKKRTADGQVKEAALPKCFYGLQLTGNALLGVYELIQQEFPDFELATARGNQDRSEHWFAILRAHGGNCRNPSARMVRVITRHALSLRSIKIGDQGNVKCQNDNYLTASSASAVSKAFDSQPLISGETMQRLEIEDFNDLEEIHDIVEALQQFEQWEADESVIEDRERLEIVNKATERLQQCSLYEKNAITFFAGYVAHKLLKSVKCDKCQKVMIKTPMDESNDNEIYIEWREYENFDIDAPTVTKLRRPTEAFYRIFAMQLETFERVCEKYWASQGVKKNILSEIQKDVDILDPSWFDPNNPCCAHRIQAADFMTKVKIYSQTKKNNRETLLRHKANYGRSQKMKNVSHQ